MRGCSNSFRRALETDLVARRPSSVASILIPLFGAMLLVPTGTTAQAPHGRAVIAAEPNPVPVRDGLGTARIRWSTGTAEPGQIFLSADGGAEQLFAEGAEGTQDAPWINPSSKYEFRLYAGREHRALLASVLVTGVISASAPAGAPVAPPAGRAGSPTLTASPNPVPTAGSPGETIISWDTGDGRPGQVYLYVPRPGAVEQLFAAGAHGTRPAPWIDPHATYEFRLYAGEQRTTRLATIEVTALPPSARDAPLLSVDTAPSGRTQVVWDTAGDAGQVYAERPRQPGHLIAQGTTGTAELDSAASGAAHRLVLYAGQNRERALATVAVARTGAVSWFSGTAAAVALASLPLLICVTWWLVRGRPASDASVIAAFGAVAYFLFAATRHLHLPGLNYDEVLFVNAALGGETDSFMYSRVFGVPFMLGNYIGALKAWLHYPVFQLFGVSPAAVRLPTVLLAAMAILTAFALARRLWGAWPGAVFAALIATDPAFIFHARMDWGPAMLSLLLKMAALYFFFRLIAAPRLRFTAALVATVVLGVFDKTIFVWFIVALTVAALVCYRRVVWSVVTTYRTQTLAAALVTGAAVFFLLRLVFHDFIALLLTLGSPAILADRIRFVLGLIGATADGSATFSQATATHLTAPSLVVPVFFLMVSAFAATWYMQRRSGWSNATEHRLTPFFAVVALVIAVQIVLTPQAIQPHHMMTLYPFHHLVLIAGTVAACRRSASWAPRPRVLMRGGLAVALAILVLSQHRAVVAHLRAFDERNQFSYAWTPRIYTLSGFVEGAAPQLDLVVVGDWGIYNQLFALGSAQTRPKLHETFRVLDSSAPAANDHLEWLRLYADRGNVAVVLHAPGAQLFTAARTNFLAFAANHMPPANTVFPIRDALGNPVFEVYVYRGRPADD